MISWADFEKLDLRIGTILSAEPFPEAQKPAYKLLVDFGEEVGLRKSSAQITDIYSLEELPGKQVIGVVNFPSKQIGPFKSECLILGAYDENSRVILLQPEKKAPNGSKIG